MHNVTINNFGPIENVSINLENKIQVFIGEQASGKSTICKIVYFCCKIKQYLIDFICKTENATQSKSEDYYQDFRLSLRDKFFELFGTCQHMDYFAIKYEFNNYEIEIKLKNSKSKNNKRVVCFYFDDELQGFIREILTNYHTIISKRNSQIANPFDARINSALFIEELHDDVRRKVEKAFNDSHDALYIPAGRSLLSILSDSVSVLYSSLNSLDLVTKEFVSIIREMKDRFGRRIDEMIQRYAGVNPIAKSEQVKEAISLVKNILKGNYVNDSDGEKIFFDDEHWVKLMFGSSGQQEALWIALLCFIIILQNKDYFLIIEEPEAHLFPNAQFEISKLITLVSSSTKSNIIVTTHSPYILSSFNVFLLRHNVKKSSKIKGLFKIDSKLFDAYKLTKEDGKTIFHSVLEDDNGLISFSYIDSISNKMNAYIDEMLDENL